ncbi:MAG: LLM class flavin-dependent oxidoreductase [Acidimicrobiia bacterium]|nr:LLM class flavin-dependent oxidoreductase [Acidimicrobiia bacterium]
MTNFGFDFAPFGALADPVVMAELAVVAEGSGWDGVFVWDHIMYREPVTDVGDPWIGLAVIAAATESVALGVMVTPLPRRRPQIVARQSVGIDQVSGGRFVLGVGLGLDRSGRELSAFNEELDDKTRAVMLDESLNVINRLWSGEAVSHDGDHYVIDDVAFLPRPISTPRPPIWVAGRWPFRRPMRRAAAWDGLFLIDCAEPAELAEAADFVLAERGSLDGFDIVTHLPRSDDAGPWREAGATWIMTKTRYTASADELFDLASQGPWIDGQ